MTGIFIHSFTMYVPGPTEGSTHNIYTFVRMPFLHLRSPSKLRTKPLPLVLLNENLGIGVRVDGQCIQWIEIACSVEQIFVDFPIVSSQAAVELPIRKLPRIHQPHRMRPNILQQFHHCLRSRQLDLPHCDGSAGEELARLPFQCVQGVKPKQLLQ